MVGSGTGIPSPQRGPAGYLLTVDGQAMLFDCGPGTMERLLRRGFDVRSIDWIFLTHHHPDHCADIIAFIFANNWEVQRRQHQPLHLVGPRTTRTFIEKLYDAFPGLSWTKFAPSIEEWEHGETRSGWTVRGAPVDHADLPALGYRVEHEGRAFVYSGDTAETPRIVELARGADTLLVECSFPDDVKGQTAHLTAGGAGRVAHAAGVRRPLRRRNRPRPRRPPPRPIIRGPLFRGHSTVPEIPLP